MRFLVCCMILIPCVVWGQIESRAGSVVPDTMVVTASGEDLSEIIAAIGQHMRTTDLQSGPYSYTTETIRRDRFGDSDTTGVLVVYRNVARLSRDGAGAVGRVTLEASTRRYEDGVLVWESGPRKAGRARWREPGRPLLDSLPFAVGAANKYNYAILARKLVGNTLLYHIAFSPRNRFDRLPSGEVWVDFTGWVMRRMTARMERGTTPTVMLAEVPCYHLEVEQRNGLWLPVVVHLVMNLNPSPLVTLPRAMDIQVTISGVEVPGHPDDGHPRTLATGDGDPRELWLDPQAARDSLATFWQGVDRQQPCPPQSLLGDRPVAVPDDSLVAWADEELAALAVRGRSWGLRAWPLVPGFNRVQGLTPSLSVELRQEGAARPAASATVGLGVADGRLQTAVLAGGDIVAHKVVWWSNLHTLTPTFGVTPGQPWRDVSALAYGHDPRHFYAEHKATAGWKLSMGRGFVVEGSAGFVDQRPLVSKTHWNLAGYSLSPAVNMPADKVSGGRLALGLGWQKGSWDFQGGLVKLTGLGRPGPLQLSLSARWRGMDPRGNAWLVSIQGRRWTRTAPLQDQVWLGDVGTLSGWSAGVSRGNTGAWGSVGMQGSGDLWRTLRMPLLGNLGLQPVGLLEAGLTKQTSTWDQQYVNTITGVPLASVGLGFQRFLGLPWLGSLQQLRLLAAWPIGPGASDEGLRFVFSFTKGSRAP